VAQSDRVLVAIGGVGFEDALGALGGVILAGFFEFHFKAVDIGRIHCAMLQDDPGGKNERPLDAFDHWDR
jgi:hypothetical protein